MLIITGLGRSGTSCLANYCCSIGYPTGGKWFDSINAGREFHKSVSINNDIAAAVKNGTWDIRNFKDRIESIKKPVIKDPRFTWDIPAILETWSSCRGDLKFIVCHRDFNSISESKKNTNASSLRSVEECRETFFAFMERLLDLNLEFRVLKFPDYIGQFGKTYDCLTGFGGLRVDKAIARKKWNDWVDSSKVNFR